ncbi:N-lysine methyltransferase KMT5A-A-like [Oculina patagonica]
MAERIQHYMSLHPKPTPPIELHDVPSDPRKAGKCAFASRDIKKHEIICEYEGEVVGLEESKRRENEYREQGKVCVLMVLDSAGIAIDPYRGSVQSKLPWGATLNHSRKNANVKPFVVNKNSNQPRVFFIALRDIPQTVELLWDYNDPEWALYSNSQTLPE